MRSSFGSRRYKPRSSRSMVMAFLSIFNLPSSIPSARSATSFLIFFSAEAGGERGVLFICDGLIASASA